MHAGQGMRYAPRRHADGGMAAPFGPIPPAPTTQQELPSSMAFHIGGPGGPNGGTGAHSGGGSGNGPWGAPPGGNSGGQRPGPRPQGPWGGGPRGGGGGQPPDIDDLIAKAQAFIRGLLPPG